VGRKKQSKLAIDISITNQTNGRGRVMHVSEDAYVHLSLVGNAIVIKHIYSMELILIYRFNNQSYQTMGITIF
jgi:hypothetical protein